MDYVSGSLRTLGVLRDGVWTEQRRTGQRGGSL